VQYYYTFDTNGDAQVNSSVLELMINPLVSTNLNDLPKFGMTFLQAAYMHANYDDDTLTLWQAEPTERESLVGVGKSTRGCPSTNSSNSTPSTSSSAASSSSSTAVSPNKGGSTLSSGTIAGIVVGIVALVALLAGAAFWYLRYRRRQNSNATIKPVHVPSGNDVNRYSAPMYRKWELDATSSATTSWGGQDKELPAATVDRPVPELPAERYD
jgi:hypothetical protein